MWLEDVEFDESVERQAERDGQLLLCSLHSDRFQVPVGWRLIDQRNPARSLWTHEVEELPRRSQPEAKPKPKLGKRRKRSNSASVDRPDTLWDVECGEIPEADDASSDTSGRDGSEDQKPETQEPTSMRLLDRDHPAVDGESIGISFEADSPLLKRAFLASRRAS